LGSWEQFSQYVCRVIIAPYETYPYISCSLGFMTPVIRI
jgi:hypothetical protein